MHAFIQQIIKSWCRRSAAIPPALKSAIYRESRQTTEFHKPSRIYTESTKRIKLTQVGTNLALGLEGDP